MKAFIAGTIAACLLLPVIGSGALADAARNSPIGAQPGNLSPGALARFKLEAVSFGALDETGWFDWTGSDEVYVSIHVPARNVATISQVFEDVNTDEARNIPSDQNCILPIAGVTGPKGFIGHMGDRWSCSPDGAAGPFSFTVVLREKDGCISLQCGFTPGVWTGQEPGPIDDVDDYIGRHTVEYSMENLMALQVGQSKENGGLVSDGDGIYEFNWRITRLPDAEPNVGPVARLREPNSRE